MAFVNKGNDSLVVFQSNIYRFSAFLVSSSPKKSALAGDGLGALGGLGEAIPKTPCRN